MKRPVRDLFEPVLPQDRLSPVFRDVMQRPSYKAARELMNAIFVNFRDVDGTFVREFQTAGFSPRVFELALFSYLEEQDLDIDRTHAAPDFLIRGTWPAAIEVTTTNPSQGVEPEEPPSVKLVPDDLDTADRTFVFQLGKALRRKLQHRDAHGRAYWEKPHVTGVPFIIAVGAFHDVHAQFHPGGLVAEYLYGNRTIVSHDDAGRLVLTTEDIGEHHLAGKTIPSGLFRHPAAADLSGVLFSNAHTMSMFNRIGAEQGLGPPDVALCRVGTCYSNDANASEPELFAYVVGDRSPGEQETFAEGLHLFINPWAHTPLPPEALPNITFHELQDDGHLLATCPPGRHPFVSKTMVYEGENAYIWARRAQLAFLGRLPIERTSIDHPEENSR